MKVLLISAVAIGVAALLDATEFKITDLGDDETMWKDCWIIGPSGLLRDGDSGAAVFIVRDSSFLGTYVAQSELPGSKLSLIHYVQDAFRLEQEVLRNWKITFRMGP